MWTCGEVKHRLLNMNSFPFFAFCTQHLRFVSCRSPPGSTTSGAPHQRRASTPPQCLMKTSSVSSRGCRRSAWTSSAYSCPRTTRTAPRRPIQSPLVAYPARTLWRTLQNFMSKKKKERKWRKWKKGRGQRSRTALRGKLTRFFFFFS